MAELKIGGTLPQFAGRGEGTFFEAGANGYTLVYLLDRPRPDEIAAMSAGQSFDIRSLTLNGAVWILTKCGSMAWTDAPYSPHMSAHVSELIEPTDPAQGTLLTLILLDTRTTEIKALRAIGLGHDFSRQLYRDIQAELAKPFGTDYYRRVAATQAAYSTKKLADLASNRWRLR